MPIPPDSPGRGCASNFADPVSQSNETDAQNLVNTVYHVNCERVDQPLANIIYRTGAENCDVARHVFRWDTRNYTEIFNTGFQARPQEDTPDNTYYNLHEFVQNSGEPGDPDRRSRHAFVSATLNTSWHPNPSTRILPPGGEIRMYRYEIYAPGGIWIAATLRPGSFSFESQAEVCFVGGIAPQYIRSAQLCILTRQPNQTRFLGETRDRTLAVHSRFNPLPTVEDGEYLIHNPVCYYIERVENVRRWIMLAYNFYPPLEKHRMERDVSISNNVDWNAVAEKSIYTIDATFRARATNEVYVFMKNEYALLNYAPGTTNDYIIGGPKLICDGYPSLIGTPFEEHGIDCAFDTDDTEAFIFCSNLCAYIDYAPGTTNDKILSGPMAISDMFHFFKNDKLFENGVDAAFRSTSDNQAYLFRFNKYALIDYKSKNLIAFGTIGDAFPSLLGTIFELKGIDAAFASHRSNEAYLFKDQYYALIKYKPGGAIDDHCKVKEISPNWPSSLGKILPRQNGGLDYHYHEHITHAQPPPVHDEL